MKKLAAILMVLVMASLANADLTVWISGPGSLNFGQTGTYIIGYSGAEILSADIDIVSDAGTQPFGISNGVILAPNANRDPIIGLPLPPGGNYELAAINDTTGIDLGSPLFAFDFTAPASGTIGQVVTISMIENSFIDLSWEPVYGAILQGKEVIITPEPMTLALLGLGGLFIRRK